MGERETPETAAAARSQSVVHFTERDQDGAARLVASLLDRVATADGVPAFLAVLPNSDDVLGLCEAVRAHRGTEARALSPVTSVARGRRLLSAGTAAIAGQPSDLARLIGESRLRLSALNTLVFVWPEETLADEQQRQSLESLIGELPRTTERVAICAARSPELTAFLERSMWRARTVDHASPAVATTGSTLRAVTAVPTERFRALRSLLDAFDPESAVLLTFSDASESTARDAASILGLDTGLVRVSRGAPDTRFRLGIIFDDVPSAEDLSAAASMTDELVAIVRPARLAALQKVAAVTPIAWTGALAAARSTLDSLRDEIRGTAGSGSHVPWINVVEPLLEGLDAVEVAAAALMLLDRERRKAKRAAVTAQQAPAPAERPVREERPRPFGDRREGARGDFGRKPREGGTRGTRGRDEDPRRGPARDRGDRPRRDESGTSREGREGREGRGGRGAPGARGPRGARGRDERGERPPRRDDIERVPRAAGEGREWAERGERLRHSRRGPRGGEGRSE